ncbi:Xaa-Pro aminopeptidase [Aphanothece sacrum FPU3]|nr:Xaa-Pro aminopeptidase [Aphanothece sacrum FPU3]
MSPKGVFANGGISDEDEGLGKRLCSAGLNSINSTFLDSFSGLLADKLATRGRMSNNTKA